MSEKTGNATLIFHMTQQTSLSEKRALDDSRVLGAETAVGQFLRLGQR
jgi:hypothetical protein